MATEDVTSGRDGYALLASSELCNLSGWTMTYDQAILETVTHCSSGFTITARGNIKISGTITVKWDDLIRAESLAKTDSLVALELHMTASKYWSGSARMGAITHNVNVETGAIQDLTIAFVGHGTWTLT